LEIWRKGIVSGQIKSQASTKAWLLLRRVTSRQEQENEQRVNV